MPDDRLRELERAWRTSGSVTDEAAFLRERLRAGALERRSLELAAHLGDPAARQVLELLAREDDSPLGEWLAKIAEWGHPAAARALVAAGRVGLPKSWRRNHHPEDCYEALIDAAEEWIRDPSPVHQIAVAGAAQAAATGYQDWVATACMGLVGQGITAPERAAASLAAFPAAAQGRDLGALRARVREELTEWALGRRDPIAERPAECGLRLGREEDIVRAVAFSPDGTRALSSSRGSVQLWHTAERLRWRQLSVEAREVFSGCFSPDGKRLLLGQDDGQVTLWDLDRCEQVGQLSGHDERVNSVSWIDDRAWSAGYDGTVREWEVDSGACLRVLEGHPRSAAAAVDRRAGLIASGDADGLLLLRDLKGAELARVGHPSSVTGVAIGRGGTAVTACYDGRLRVWQRGGALRYELSPSGVARPETTYGLAIEPSGRRAATVSMDMSLRVWDLEGGAELKGLWTLGPCFAVAWSHDARWLLTGARNGALRLWPTGHPPEVSDPLVQARG